MGHTFPCVAEDENGTVLNTKDEFIEEAVQQEWIEEETKDEGMSKEDFQQQRRKMLNF